MKNFILYSILAALLFNNQGVWAAGADVILGELPNTSEYSDSNDQDDIVSLAVGTTSCNAGDAVLNWHALPSNKHPVISMNLYRLLNGQMKQIGQSWVKHGYYALQGDTCNLGCQPNPTNDGLGVGCSDPYPSGLNHDASRFGRRGKINPFTGEFDGNTALERINGQSESNHGIRVNQSDLGISDSKYYIEGQYIAADDARAGNGNNNTSYREILTSKVGNLWRFGNNGGVVRKKSAIRAWAGAKFVEYNDPNDGLIIVGYKVTKINDNSGYQYEYAIYNKNNERGIGMFQVPKGNANITNKGFHAVRSYGEGWSNDPWQITENNENVIWSTETFETNQNSNAIRWGTTFNFWFTANRAPEKKQVTLRKFKPGEGEEGIVLNIDVPGESP